MQIVIDSLHLGMLLQKTYQNLSAFITVLASSFKKTLFLFCYKPQSYTLKNLFFSYNILQNATLI